MFDIGFSELLLVLVIGLIVLGPQRLPVAVKTVMSWIRALRSLAASVQNELAQELKLQELQDSLKKVEKASLDNLTPELKSSMDELRQAAQAMRRSYPLPNILNSGTSPETSCATLSSSSTTTEGDDAVAVPEADTTAQAETVLQAAKQQVTHDKDPTCAVPTTNTTAPSSPDKS